MKYQLIWEEQRYNCEWFENTNFEDLDAVSSILGFIFDDEGKICVIKLPDRDKWTLPGGHLEKYDKDHIACLIREVEEEADLIIKDIKPLGYIKVYPINFPEKIDYQLRFVARVKEIKEQTIDPAEGVILGRKFIPVEKFGEYVKWEKHGLYQLEKALEVLKD